MSSTDVRPRPDNHASVWPAGIAAGLAGGAIEIGWIALYQGLANHESLAVARGVTQSLIPELGHGAAAAPLGIAIHMILAVLLGLVIALVVHRFLPRIAGTAWEPAVVVGMLVGVWALNFLVILPVLNPGFVTIVPYGASFVSKMLFGFAAAFTFRFASRPGTASR